MDLNDPVKRYEHTTLFKELHMKESILMTYLGAPPPVTNILNKSNQPIDGIWCSLYLTALQTGYSTFKEDILSDHRFFMGRVPNHRIIWDEVQHNSKDCKT